MKSWLYITTCMWSLAQCYKDYNGYQTFAISIESESDGELIRDLIKSSHFSIWKEARRVGDHFDVMIDPESLNYFKTLLQASGLEYKVVVEDVGVVINSQRQQWLATREEGKLRDFTDYEDLAGINLWIDDLQSNFTELVQVGSIGTSYEGRDIRIVQISTGGTGKPVIFMDACNSAHEWIATATATYLIQKLLTNYNNGDTVARNILDNVDIHFVPVLNVDGYEYSFTTDRLWKKSRSPNQDPECPGKDLNRNWDGPGQFCEFGGSTDPCDDIYCGSVAFSEVELQNLVNYIEDQTNVQMYLAYHNYGNWIGSPYSYSFTQTPDDADIIALCEDAVAALFAVNGEVFACDSIADLVGLASGSSVDYTLDTLGIQYNYGLEIRGDDVVVPPEEIIPSGEENYAAFVVLAQAVIPQKN